MHCFFLFFSVILAEKFDFSDILTAEGIDMTQLNKWNKLKRIFSIIKPDSQVGDILLESLNYNRTEDNPYSQEYLKKEYNRIYKYFFDNQTRILINSKDMSNPRVDFVENIATNMKTQLFFWGIKINKIKSILEDISKNKNKTTVENIVQATHFSLSHYFLAAEIAKNAMTFSPFKLKEAPPKLDMNSDKIMEMIADIPKSIENDKINIYEMCLHFHNMMKGIINFKNGTLHFTIKSLIAALTPYAMLAPESKTSYKYIAKSFISAYDKSKKLSNLSDSRIQSIVTVMDPIVDNLRDQLNTHIIEINASVSSFVSKNMDYARPNLKLMSLLLPKNYSFLYDEGGLISALRFEENDLFRPFVTTIMGNSRAGEIAKTYSTAKAALIYLRNPRRKIPSFNLSFTDKITFAADKFKDIRTNITINEYLARKNINPLDPETIKNAISEFIEGLKEIKGFYPGFIEYAIDFLNTIKDAIKDNMTLGDLLAVHPLGRSFATFIEANNKYNDGASMKEAFWDFEVLGVYVMRTIEAWKNLSLLSAPNLLHSIVTKTEDAKNFLEKFDELWGFLYDNLCQVKRDELDAIYPGFTKFVKKMKPGFEYFMLTPTELYLTLTGINISRLTESFYQTMLEINYGKLTWETFLNFNKLYYEVLYEPLYIKYGEGTITRLAKKIIIGICVPVIFISVVIIIVIFILRRKLHAKDNEYTIQTESINSEVDSNKV